MKKIQDMTLKEKLGQLIIAGFDGYEFDDHLKTLIEDYKVSNIILFTRNISNLPQLLKLNRQIHESVIKNTGTIPFISIDQEGGMVTRIMNGATFCPGNMTLTATNNPDNCYEVGRIMSEELSRLGINMNLAPSLDVNNNPSNPVIGVRSYSDNPKVVSEYGKKYIEGFQKNGLIATAKHFPGHGDTAVDSHLGLPTISYDRNRIDRIELVPFKDAIKNDVSAIMSAHIVFSKIEKSLVPATLSYVILTSLLRGELGFKGLIVSDCMQMKAIDTKYTTEKGTVMGIKAGLDIACISHTLEKQVNALKLLEEAVLNNEIDISLIDEKVERILSFKEKTFKALKENFYDVKNEEILKYFENDEAKKFAQKIVDESLTLIKGKAFVKEGKTLLIAPTPFAQTIAEDKLDSRSIVDMVKNKNINIDAIKLDLNSSDYSDILKKATKYDQVFFCSYNLASYPLQRKLINDIKKEVKELYVTSTRNPYDYLYLDEVNNLCSLYEYTPNSVNTIIRYIEGKIAPKGKFPIEQKKKLSISASLYLGLDDYKLEDNIKYLYKLKQSNMNQVFISAHMPEMKNTFNDELKKIIEVARDLSFRIVLDVNKDRLSELVKEDPNVLDGIFAIRLDYGFTKEEILKLINTSICNIELNASVVSKDVIEYLKAYNADFSKVRVSHNFYPKLYTGLSYEMVKEKNDYFKNLGIYVIQYIPSNNQHRAPLYEGLPTIEEQRNSNLYAILSEALILNCDEVCFGDAFISDEEIQIATSFDTNYITLPIVVKKGLDKNTLDNLLKVHQARVDEAVYFVRSSVRTTGIKPFNTVKRNVLDVTVDNEEFKRYQGEICIMRKELEADSRVNVIGTVKSSKYLIDNLKSNYKFKFKIIGEE